MASRRLSQRPADFRLDPRSPLHQGLVFAGLGRAPGTFTYYDSSPHVNSGTLTGYTGTGDTPADRWQYAPTLGRWVLSFDGTNNYVSIPTFGGLGSATTPLSVSIWANPVEIGVIPWITQIGAEHFTFSDSGNFRWYSNGGTYIVWSSPIPLAAWTHLAVTYTAGDFRAYRNGIQVHQRSDVSGPMEATASNLAFLGSYNGGSYKYNGIYSDPLIYTRILDPAEVAALADPSNVDLRVGGMPLILPPRRRLFAMATAAPATPRFRRTLSLRSGSRGVA